MAKFVTEVTYLDNNFTPIPAGVSLKDKEIYIEKTSRYQVLLGGKKGPEQISKVSIVKGVKRVTLAAPLFKKLSKKGLSIGKAFEEGMKMNPGSENSKVTFKKNFNIKYFGAFVGVLGVLVGVIMFFALQTDKNFSGEVKEFNSLSEVGIGDYVRTDGEYWDAYGITLETTNTVYGIETSTDTSEGNTYVIMTKPISEETNFEEELETFIFRYAAGSSYDIDFNSLGVDEYILKDLKGEVKDLSSVESVDSGPTAIEYFNQFLTEFNAQEETYGVLLAEPEFIIDGRVTQANLVSDVLIPSGIVIAIGIIGLVVFFVFNKKHMQEMNDFIMKVEGKKTKSPIERN